MAAQLQAAPTKSARLSETSYCIDIMAWNDPQWGKKDNAGPPDLDELWRRFNQRLSGMFGGKGGEPGNSGLGGTPPRGLVGLLIGLAFLVWLATGFYIVDAGSRGVEQRFGKYTATTGPGAHLRMPWPIESSRVVNVESVRTIEVGYRGKSKNLQESLMLTDDENIVDLQFDLEPRFLVHLDHFTELAHQRGLALVHRKDDRVQDHQPDQGGDCDSCDAVHGRSPRSRPSSSRPPPSVAGPLAGEEGAEGWRSDSGTFE